MRIKNDDILFGVNITLTNGDIAREYIQNIIHFGNKCYGRITMLYCKCNINYYINSCIIAVKHILATAVIAS